MFKPPLPEQKVNRCLHDNRNANKEISPQMTQKVEAIEKLGFGVMDKIFLAFDKVFWDQVKSLLGPGKSLLGPGKKSSGTR